METVRKSVLIEAPVARAWEYMLDPAHLPEIWPSMVEVKNAEVRPDGSHSFDWTYRMAGIPFHGHCETIDVEAPRRRVTKNERGIPSTFRWGFEQRDGRAEVTMEVEYELPIPLFGRLAAPFLRRLNEREAETLLANLKARLEAQEPAGTEPPRRPTAVPPPPPV